MKGMKLEDAIKVIKEGLIKEKYCATHNYIKQAIETVLDELEDLGINNLRLSKENKLLFEELGSRIPKQKIEDKIKEQIEEADEVLVGKEYIDNFDGSDENQEYYYKGYKDASLFIRDTLED